MITNLTCILQLRNDVKAANDNNLHSLRKTGLKFSEDSIFITLLLA